MITPLPTRYRWWGGFTRPSVSGVVPLHVEGGTMEYVTMNDKTLALARSFRLATLLMLHSKVQDNVVWETARDAAELTHYARIVGRYNVLKCNQPTTKRQDTVGRNALEYAVEIAAKYGAKIHVGDPRGPVRIYWADELPKGDPDTYTKCMTDIEV